MLLHVIDIVALPGRGCNSHRKPQLDEELYKHTMSIIEIVNADAASPEQKGRERLASQLPNLLWQEQDPTRASRRTRLRPSLPPSPFSLLVFSFIILFFLL